jgi:hypothetical protein
VHRQDSGALHLHEFNWKKPTNLSPRCGWFGTVADCFSTNLSPRCGWFGTVADCFSTNLSLRCGWLY